ncbi:MAG: acyltransferase [Gammaproteobacteria bacterium]|nr:acyltransferase [Gammaproteobacteria bacterium]
MIKKRIKKNKFLYFKLSLIKKITFPLWLINIIFQKVFRRHSELNFNINFTSSYVLGKNIEYYNDINTLSSFAVSGHCYFQSINNIKLGRNILFSSGVKLISANHDVDNLSISIKASPIVIGNNVWIGANAIILPKVVIGDNCIIGAGAVVTKSFTDDNLTIAGNPARIINRK